MSRRCYVTLSGWAAETGTSTMAVYAYFGSTGELVREIVHDGFARSERTFSLVKSTSDPVAHTLPGRPSRMAH